MNICFHCFSLFPTTLRGGISYYVLRIARELTAQGEHSIHILTDHEPDADWTDPPNVRLHVVKVRWLPVVGRWFPGVRESAQIARALWRVHRRYGIDVVEFPNWEAPNLIYNWWKPAPSVTRLSTSFAETRRIDELQLGPSERFALWSERAAALDSTALMTHTLAHRRTMVAELGVREERIGLVPHGIEVPEQFPEPAARAPDAPLKVLFVGRLEHRKGIFDLLQALPAVVDRAPRFDLTIIGRDRRHAPGGRTFRQYFEQEFPPAMKARVTFCDVASDAELDNAYRTTDLFVAPALYESFGLTYIEAMRYGKPVIGCRAGGVPEVVKDGVTGVLVPPSDPEELAKAMIALLSNDALRNSMGREAHRWTKATYSIHHTARRQVEFYREVIARENRR
ncbi:MAG: glycosyltransferase family 4 protein [Candidatus Brocadiia bacterium]|jgi:glycosyltransferase involved in cell wall biosynthesis